MEVKLLPKMTPTESASHAALRCYQTKEPEVGKTIDVENNLFLVSHHTTLQHSDSFNTFGIKSIAVGDVTYGLHLVNPFYNADQQSGRYAGKMFVNPDFNLMLGYIKKYWPKVKQPELKAVESYLRYGVAVYQSNKKTADNLAKVFLKKERPSITNDMLERIAPKVAQEQLRMFISTIFPTGLDFTLNLTALTAMYEEAWTPAMKDATDEMVKGVVGRYPDVAYMFDEGRRRDGEWSIAIPSRLDIGWSGEPLLSQCHVSGENLFKELDPSIMHPVDRSHFSPELMDNSIGDISFRVAMSVATMGQDQRHRTLRRGTPSFLGLFYLPPLLKEMGLEKGALALMKKWISVSENLPESLAMILSPYGAMVEYTKKGSFNAIAHEQFKRLCWCAQEEIYYLGVLERKAIQQVCGSSSKLLSMFQPPCFVKGKCAEGGRFCGRDISVRKNGDYFSRRMV